MKYYTSTTEFNCGIDLHARQMYVCVMDRQGHKLLHTNIRDNDFAYFLKLVQPYRHSLTVCCECMFGWYWLLHLIGDMHQPLHCSSFFNDTYPTGDKGGNSFYVKPATRGINLHSFWDGLLGTSGKANTHLNYAIRLESEYPAGSLPELKKHTTPKEWSLEARGIAVEKAYMRGALKGGVSAQTAADLADGYTRDAKAVAEKQGVLAGYRLADEIRKYMK